METNINREKKTDKDFLPRLPSQQTHTQLKVDCYSGFKDVCTYSVIVLL